MIKLPPPPTVPDDPKVALRRLIPVAAAEVQRGSNPADRQKFSKLLDAIINDKVELPADRKDGRATHPTQRACLYAVILQAIHQTREGQDASRTIRKAQSLYSGGAFTIAGNVGTGWIAEEVK